MIGFIPLKAIIHDTKGKTVVRPAAAIDTNRACYSPAAFKIAGTLDSQPTAMM